MAEEKNHETPDSSTNGPVSTNGIIRDSNGWDGKLRVGRRAEVVNAEILSDPENSDEDAPPVELISADDGRTHDAYIPMRLT